MKKNNPDTIKRYLEFNNLPENQSAFLWGARKTGKSTLLKEMYPHCLLYDLLESDLFLRLSKEPHLLREELLNLEKNKKTKVQRIVIDEIQKIPELLDEIHWLIENKRYSFILCGSSARKLKKAHANLLAGRAWRYELYPFSYIEIDRLGKFDLLSVLNRGLIPSHYLSSNYQKSLHSYVVDYLNEEIRSEGLVRNPPAFAKFLDAVGYSHGELINYANIARDCAIDAKTVKEYYQILEDTLLGHFVLPYSPRKGRATISAAPKFYLFYVGVAGYLRKRTLLELKGPEAGHAFEHFILMELVAYRSYNEKNFSIEFWRTKSGLEVDFVLNRGTIALEIKISNRIDKNDLQALITFHDDFCKDNKQFTQRAIIVSQEKRARSIEINESFSIEILPWKNFLNELWARKII